MPMQLSLVIAALKFQEVVLLLDRSQVRDTCLHVLIPQLQIWVRTAPRIIAAQTLPS